MSTASWNPTRFCLSKVVAEDSQRVSMAPTMAAEAAGNKLAGPKGLGLDSTRKMQNALRRGALAGRWM